MTDTIHRFERHPRRDPSAAALLADLRSWPGLAGATALRRSRVFVFDGPAAEDELEALGRELLHHPLTETLRRGPARDNPNGAAFSACYRPGVTDPLLQSLAASLADRGSALRPLGAALRYEIDGRFEPEALQSFARRFLFNPLSQRLGEPEPPRALPEPPERHPDVPLAGLDDAALLDISRRGGLALDATEMRAARAHFEELGRAPTEIELETLAQTWSEHCVHKTFKAKIRHGDRLIDNLLKESVVAATEAVAAPYCVSVFVDNAGIVRFDDDFDLCFKAETHNHPSAIDPYGGSATGLGGVIRDILGAGLGARPILGFDVFCLGPQDLDNAAVPDGSHHPRRIRDGVVGGIRDYGNRIGIPTVCGALYFDEGYIANPIVLAGCLGVMPRGMDQKSIEPGDLVVLVGAHTGRDGIHGVTFSSEALSSASEELDRSAVQIGNPIAEQVIIDPLLRARDAGLYRSITDCGGGGLSSAIGEMGEERGVEVELEKVPLKEAGLSPTEIWISESQERMVLAVPPERWPELKKIFEDEEVPCTAIGRFRDDARLVLRFRGQVIGDMAMAFLHDGLPRRELVSKPPARPERPAGHRPSDRPFKELVLAALGHPDTCSKADVVRQYDFEVQGGTVLGPFAGPGAGPSDGVVVLPRLDSERGAVVGLGYNPRFAKIDPYLMAANAVDEAVRNVVAAGADPDRLSLLDNFIWGDVSDPEELGGLVEAALACRDLGQAFEAPFISGKDSLNNTHLDDQGRKRSITPTLVISALSIIDDAARAVSIDLKEPGDRLYLFGRETAPELGGSSLYDILGRPDEGRVPEVDAAAHLTRARRLYAAVNAGLVRACHDCSEGGLIVALAEMAIAGELGARCSLAGLARLSSEEAAFSETSGRYLLAARPGDAAALEALLGPDLTALGSVEAAPRLVIDEEDMALDELTRAWRAGRPT